MPVQIHGPSGQSFPVMGLIDTGADITLIPEDWAEPLGIQIADCEVVDGGSAAGSSEFRLWNEPVYLTVLEREIELLPHALRLI